jgi:chemotaxis family two-component system response regulator Rcp1
MVTHEIGRPVEILLVDDNFADIDLMKEGLQKTEVSHNLQVAMDGVEAMALLRKEKGFEKAVRPDLILLDLGLPKKDGREVLAEVKSDPALKCIPVIVLSSSTAETDVKRSYDLHANCYISKSIEWDKFMASVKSIEEFWLGLVKLPPCGD